MSRLFGYARVSTATQSLELQKKALREVGVTDFRIFCDKQTGANLDRPGLETLLMKIESGDILNVTATDRLGRDSLDMMHLIKQLDDMGVVVRFIQQGLTTEGAAGRTLVEIMTVLAAAERRRILERTTEGRLDAMARGVKFGRKLSLPRDEIIALSKAEHTETTPKHTAIQIAKKLKIARCSVYKVLKENNIKIGNEL